MSLCTYSEINSNLIENDAQFISSFFAPFYLGSGPEILSCQCASFMFGGSC